MALKREITALEFLNDDVLGAGIGRWLALIDVKSGRDISRHQVFTHGCIHGIRRDQACQDSSRFFVFGKKLLSTLELSRDGTCDTMLRSEVSCSATSLRDMHDLHGQ